MSEKEKEDLRSLMDQQESMGKEVMNELNELFMDFIKKQYNDNKKSAA
jgi:hypothetical protein